MSGPLRRAALVARREAREHARQRSFVVSTLFTCAVIVGLVVVPAVLPFGDREGPRVGYTADVPAAVPVVLADRAGDAVRSTAYPDRAAAADALRAGQIDAVVLGNGQVLVVAELAPALQDVLEPALREAALHDALAEATGQPPAAALPGRDVLEIVPLDPPDPLAGQRRLVAAVGMFVILVQVASIGFLVAQGVVEEKSSRVVELLLARVRPGELLAGKLVGLGLLGLAQLLIFVAVGLLTLAAAPDRSIPPGLVPIGAPLLVWYVAAFALFAALTTVAASLASRAEELWETISPAGYVLMLGVGPALFAFANPEGLTARVGSLLPPAAPFTMPLRAAATHVPAWEVALALASTAAACAALVAFAAGVYRRGVLQVSRRVTLRQLLRAGARTRERISA
jgi:ABC-2 type transport system permease protein